MTDSRKEFEDWCCTTFQLWVNTREGDGYDNKEIDSLWNGWQAGRQSVAKGKRTEMTEHKALSAFEQAKLQEEVEALNLRVARLATALEGLMAGYEVRCSGEENAEWDTCYSNAQRALTLDDVNKEK